MDFTIRLAPPSGRLDICLFLAFLVLIKKNVGTCPKHRPSVLFPAFSCLLERGSLARKKQNSVCQVQEVRKSRRITFHNFVVCFVWLTLLISFDAGPVHVGGRRAEPAFGDDAEQRNGTAGETAHPGGVRRRSLPVSSPGPSSVVPSFWPETFAETNVIRLLLDRKPFFSLSRRPSSASANSP